MQPTAQAVGKSGKPTSPGGAKEEFSRTPFQRCEKKRSFDSSPAGTNALPPTPELFHLDASRNQMYYRQNPRRSCPGTLEFQLRRWLQ
jgi:hypothetical protein